jgi:hypothetical protein
LGTRPQEYGIQLTSWKTLAVVALDGLQLIGKQKKIESPVLYLVYKT